MNSYNENKNYLNKGNLLLPVLIIGLITGSFFTGVAIGSEQQKANSAEADKASSSLLNMAPETELSKEEAEKIDFSTFWKTWKALEENHIKRGEVSTEDRVWSAIQGLTRAYDDPNTVFMPPKEKKEFESEISGQFEGVGMEIGIRDNVLTVVAPLQGTPAEKAGIESGDKIIEIDGEATKDLNVSEAVDLIRGEKGTEVVLSISREGEPELLEIPITRGVIDIPTIETEMREDGIFVIKLFNFAGKSTEMFEEAMKDFRESGADKLILDLRNNPGGYLHASVEVASYFLPAGEIVLKEQFSDERETKVYRSKGYEGFNGDKEMAILVNQGSASASEIVAGALGDHDVATIVGNQTFGKGSVQEVVSITSDTSLKVTIAEWLTPDGHSFEGEGIEPDVEVDMTREDVENELDPQMNEAAE
ncbi:MAG: S41 family peptidase, partial [Patescibacteria group bacterium]